MFKATIKPNIMTINGEEKTENRTNPTISPIIKGIENRVINIAPPKAAAFILPFTIAPFQDLNTVKIKKQTPTLQKESQIKPNKASSEEDIPIKIRINNVNAIPAKKYFLFVKK